MVLVGWDGELLSAVGAAARLAPPFEVFLADEGTLLGSLDGLVYHFEAILGVWPADLASSAPE